MIGIALSQHSLMQRRNQQGFSLIELMCVIMIMSILTAVSWSSIVSIVGGNHLSNGVYDLRGLMLQARTDAMTQNTYVLLGFSPTTKNGAPSLLVTSVAAKSGLITDLQNGNFQVLRKPILLKGVALDTKLGYLSLPGFDNAPNDADASASDAVTSDTNSQSAYAFKVSVAGNSQTQFSTVIAFSPDGQTLLPQSGGALKLVSKVRIGLNASPSPANSTRNAAVQMRGLSGQISVLQQ